VCAGWFESSRRSAHPADDALAPSSAGKVEL
jgi:hypothetical protein